MRRWWEDVREVLWAWLGIVLAALIGLALAHLVRG